MSFWNNLFQTKAEDWLFYHFPADQVAGSEPHRDLAPGKEYINVFLKSARVVNVRSGLKKFYGAVHSFITIPLRERAEPGQVTTVTTPGQLKGVDPRRLDRVVSIDHRLLGPVPAPAGDLKLEIGLFSIEQEDLVAPYLGLLEKLSGLAGVGFIQAALPFVGPISDGINVILNGQGDTLLEIGLATTIRTARTGYFLVMRVPRDDIDPTKLKLDLTDGKVVGADGRRVQDYPYLVLEISGSKEKTDWAKIPELLAQYNLIKDALKRDEIQEAKDGLKVFTRLAKLCNELTGDDAKRIIKIVSDMIDDVAGDGTLHAAPAAKSALHVPEFAELPMYP